MKQSHKKMKTQLVAMAGIACVLSASPASAQNLFLLQLGLFSAKESADAAYQASTEAHGEALKGKRYLPQQSRALSGGDASWRVLVGPYESRKSASRTCAELKASGQDCFVVETAAVNVSEMERGASFADAKPAASESRSSGLNPFGLFGSSKNEEASAPASASSEAEALAESTQASALRPVSNSNLNSRAVYDEQPARAESSGFSLVESIGSLFGGTADEAASEAVADAEPASSAPVEVPTENIATSAEVEAVEVVPAPAAPAVPEAAAAAVEVADEAPAAAIGKGEVEIAEAIPVPLTNPEDVKVTQAPAVMPWRAQAEENTSTSPAVSRPEPLTVMRAGGTPEPVADPVPAQLEPAQAATREQTTAPALLPPTPPRRTTGAGGRILQLSIFENDRVAFQCLSSIQQEIPAAGMLGARMIKSTTGQAVLRLGPVNDAELEASICDKVSTCGPEIQCRLITESRSRPLGLDAATPRPAYDGSAPMPQNLTDYTAEPPAVMTTLDEKGVWVQLGTSSSESEAKERYDLIAKEHGDVLGSFTPVINTPEYRSLAGKVYRLRVGPFQERREAHGICATLSSRGVGCLVLSR